MHYTKRDIYLNSCPQSGHPFLYPFFMANFKVREFVELWVRNNATSPLLYSVNKVREMYKYNDNNSDAYMYSEEDWTDRLANTLKLHPFFASESLACLRSFRFGHNSDLDEFRQQCFGVQRTVAARYLFHGLPDIYLINKHPRIIQCTTADVALVPQGSGLDGSSTALGVGLHTAAHTPPTAPDTSANCDTAAVPRVLIGELIGEAAKGQLGRNYPFDKMGQLLANMHCAHNDHILQHFLANDYTVQLLNITGIFLNKESGCSKFAMELKPTGQSTSQHANFTCFEYHIDHSITPAQVLDPALLCAALNEYAGVNLHRT